jgi:alkylated DNA repair dioxygenase AlkB
MPRKGLQSSQLSLFSAPPEGFAYRTDFITCDEERELADIFASLPLKEFKFQGYTGKRRVISYGWHYDFGTFQLKESSPMPDYLKEIRSKAAAFAGLAADELAHALITEYKPGTTIGWHRDRDVFEDVVGLSFLSSCIFRFRQKQGNKWERYSLEMVPRSAYLLRGAVRNDWEHSIPAVENARYSLTFRSLRSPST